MPTDHESPLYFFPEDDVTESELREILAAPAGSVMGSNTPEREKKAWAVSHLLRYAQWDDIWTYISREEVRDMFPELELGQLTDAWGRMLKVHEVTTVS